MSNPIKDKEYKGFSKENLAYYGILAPFLILFFLFTVLPVFASIALSLFDFDMVSKPLFIGLDNYIRMFTSDQVFLKTAGNSLKFALVTGPLGYILSFVLAWMINEFTPALRIFLTFIFYIPSLSGNAMLIWQVMFSGDSYAYANNLLLSFGFITEPIQWFNNQTYNFTILVIIQLWMSMGIGFLANIAGLQNVNVELYEAGAIDGIRTRWHELWYITLPSMKTMLLFSAVMQIQGVFAADTIITTLCGYPSVNNSVDMLVTYIGDIGNTRYEMGYACALSVVLFIIVLSFRTLVNSALGLIGKSDE